MSHIWIHHMCHAWKGLYVEGWVCVHGWVMSHIQMSHVTQTNGSCVTRERTCTLHSARLSVCVHGIRPHGLCAFVRMNHVTHMNESYITHMNESCHTCEWGMSHVWMNHVTHMNESCHTYEWVMAHMIEACHTYEWVMRHTWMRHVTRIIESCHTYAWVMCHTWKSLRAALWRSVCVFMDVLKQSTVCGSMSESCHTHKRDTSHIQIHTCDAYLDDCVRVYRWGICHACHAWMSHVTCEWVMCNTWLSHVTKTHFYFMSHMNESCYMRVSRVQHVTGSCDKYRWTICHTRRKWRGAVIFTSCHAYKGVMCEWVICDIWLSRVTTLDEPYVTHAEHGGGLWLLCLLHVTNTKESCVTLTKKPCATHEWVMAHVRMSHESHVKNMAESGMLSLTCCIWKSHVSPMNELGHTYEWARSHIRMSHQSYGGKAMCSASRHTYKEVICHTWIRRGTHTNESCVTHEWVMSRVRMSHVMHMKRMAEGCVVWATSS